MSRQHIHANGLTAVVEKTHTDGVIITQGMWDDIWDHFLGVVLGKKLLSTCRSLDLFCCLLKPDPSTQQYAWFWWNAVGGWFSQLLIQFKCEGWRGRSWKWATNLRWLSATQQTHAALDLEAENGPWATAASGAFAMEGGRLCWLQKMVLRHSVS